MKYLDRKRLGIEAFFAEVSSIMSMNSIDAEETVRLLCEQTRRTRSKIAKQINAGLHYLTSDSTLGVAEYLNDDIRELVKYPVIPDTVNRLQPFFEWLSEIERLNKLEIDQSRYLLNDAASHMDVGTRTLVTACAASTVWFAVSFQSEGDGLRMSFPERLWGRAALVFPHVETKFNGSLPLFGMLFWVDAEFCDGRFTFSFLMNVEFGEQNVETRLMQDRNWVRLTFTCDCPSVELEQFDYGQRLAAFGGCGHGFIEGWCGELLSKEIMLGGASLSEKEQELLPLAKLLRMAYQIMDGGGDSFSDQAIHDAPLVQKVLETLENRYQLKHIGEWFDEAGHSLLFVPIQEAAEAWTEADFQETGQHILHFAERLDELEQTDKVRELYRRLIERMRECTAAFEGTGRIYSGYAEAEEIMRQTIEPDILALGFTGSYPHYRRRRGRKGEYLSVMTSRIGKYTVNGAVRYGFSLAAAVKKLQKQKKDSYLAAGIPFEKTTAEDCHRVSDPNTKYAELGGLYDDVDAVISVDVFQGLADGETAENTAERLKLLVAVATAGMQGKAAPKWYRKKRRAAPVHPNHQTTMGSLLMKYLPLGLYLAVLLMGGYMLSDHLWHVTEFLPWLTGQTALGLAVLFGLLVTVLWSALRLRRLQKRIWKY